MLKRKERGTKTGLAVLVLATAAAGARVLAATKCYPARYQVQGSALVVDSATGLTWQQTIDPASYTQSAAMTYCAGRGAGWRLPSLTELQTIVDDTKVNPSIDGTAFPNTPSALFWTSSAYAGSAGSAWNVAFYSGNTGNDTATVSIRVRCVR